MKKFLTILSLVALMVMFTASGALAYSFDFGGGFELRDDDIDGFAEVLNFNASQFFPGKSMLEMVDPYPDPLLGPGSYVVLSEFTLNKDAYTSGVSYNFEGNPYVDGFQVYNSSDVLLLEANISLDPIVIDGGIGSINASFGLNLTEIDIKVAGSPILDAFAPPAPGGAVNFTFNIAGYDLAGMIENGEGIGGYSASAASLPEPGTLLLLGAGLIGLIGLGRKFKK